MAEPAEKPKRRQAEARRVAKERWPYRCCVVCGTTLEAVLVVAHLDQNAGNNDPDNLAWLCGTHHWMFDCDLYPIDAVKAMRARWQETRGVPDHKPRMKNAGRDAALTRIRRAAARKAVATRRRRATEGAAATEPAGPGGD